MELIRDVAGWIQIIVLYIAYLSLTWAIYLIPWIIALRRKNPYQSFTLAGNLLLGWTLIGWLVFLCLAFEHKGPPRPQQSVATV
jgi:hypothetical protein